MYEVNVYKLTNQGHSIARFGGFKTTSEGVSFIDQVKADGKAYSCVSLELTDVRDGTGNDSVRCYYSASMA